MADRVRVREIDADEGRRLVRIVRRDGGSVVTWRRAQMVLLSAQGLDVAAIAKVAFPEPGEDKLSGHIKPRKNRARFLEFCRYLRTLYPPQVQIAVICDNFSPHLTTRKDKRVGQWAAANNVEIAYALTNASWLNRIPVNRPSARRHAWAARRPTLGTGGVALRSGVPGEGSVGRRVVLVSDGHRVEGCGADGELVNRFLAHLGSRAFSPVTVRAYAFDLLNFLRFLAGRDARLAGVVATDLFDYLGWQQRPAGSAGRTVVRLGAGRGAMPATMNRRIAAVRGLFEFVVMTGARAENPAPAARRSTGLRPSRRGLLGHIGLGRPRGGGRLADVDMGLRRVRVTGKGGKERVSTSGCLTSPLPGPVRSMTTPTSTSTRTGQW